MKKIRCLKTIKRLRPLLFLLALLPALPASAADKPDFKKELLYQYSSNVEISFVMPRPAVISQLLKENNFSFTGKVAPSSRDEYSSSAKIALNLGARCADGVMMVYGDKKADDATLEKLGSTILKLMDDLALTDSLAGIEPLKKALQSKDQKQIKHSINTLVGEAELFLQKGGQNELAVLVSLGGWIEMFYYAADELSRNYNADQSKLLCMDYIVETYLSSFSYMQMYIKDTPVLLTISNQLPRVKQLMFNPENQPLSKERVKDLYLIAKNLKNEIEKP